MKNLRWFDLEHYRAYLTDSRSVLVHCVGVREEEHSIQLGLPLPQQTECRRELPDMPSWLSNQLKMTPVGVVIHQSDKAEYF